MHQLIILRGNSGSGKTTVAKALQEAFGENTLLLSQDTVRREMLCTHDRGKSLTLPLLQSLLAYGHEHCPVTVLEGILSTEWYGPLFAQAVALYGVENIHAYYYDLPFEETLKRHETKAVREEFGEPELRRWWREKDYIGFLPEKTLTAQDGLEETVALMVAQLRSGL